MEEEGQLFADFQDLLQTLRAREEQYSLVLEFVKASLRSRSEDFEQLFLFAPFIERTLAVLRPLDDRIHLLLVKHLKKPALSPKEMRVAVRMRQRLAQLFEAMHLKSRQALGNLKRLEEGHRQFSRALKEWGCGGIRPSVHALLALVVTYSKEKLSYELNKLAEYKLSLQNCEAVNFSDFYFAEQHQTPIRCSPSKEPETKPTKSVKVRGRTGSTLRPSQASFLDNVLLKNYSDLNLNRASLAEMLAQREEGAAQLKGRILEELQGRNREIGRCIAQYFERSKSELHLRVQRYLASYRPSLRQPSRSSQSESRQVTRRPRIESAHEPSKTLAKSIKEKARRPRLKSKSSAKKVFIEFLHRKRSSNARERELSCSSKNSFGLCGREELEVNNRSRLMRRLNKQGKMRQDCAALKAKVCCELKNVVMDWQGSKRGAVLRPEEGPGRTSAFSKSVLRQRRNPSRYGVRQAS